MDARGTVTVLKGVGEAEFPEKKTFLVNSEGYLVDDQNQNYPWYLFPEEDVNELTFGSCSDSSQGSGNEDDGDIVIKKEELVESAEKLPEESSEKVFGCHLCAKTFKKEGYLKRHLLKHEEDSKEAKIHYCSECDYQATCLGNIKKHALIHSGERPFQCDMCEKSFRQKIHLKDHYRSHNGRRDFECDSCGATFVQKSSLKLHQKKHSGIRPFACRLCSKSFYENQHLNNHMRTHTGEKPYQCEMCGQTFATLRTLRTHKMIHTGERPYKCEHCNVSFREKATLQKHGAVHINVGPFPCSECGKEFNRLASLTLHKRIHLQMGVILPKYRNASNETRDSSNSDTNRLTESIVVDESNLVVENNSEVLMGKNQPVNHEGFTHIICNESVASQIENEIDANVESPVKNFFNTLDSVQVSVDTSKPTPRKLGRLSRYSVNSNKLPTIMEESIDDPSMIVPETVPHIETDTNPRPSRYSANSNKLPDIMEESIDDPNMIVADNVPPPERVREALEYGTVFGTKDGDGNDMIVVLPALLSNQEIILSSLNNEPIVPLKDSKDSFIKALPGPSEVGSGDVKDLLKKSIENRIDEVAQATNDFETKDEPLGISGNEFASENQGLNIEVLTAPIEDDVPISVKGSHFVNANGMIQEDIHLWDDGACTFSEVTYVIEEGQKDPVSVSHSSIDLHQLETATPRKRKRGSSSRRNKNDPDGVSNGEVKRQKREKVLLEKPKAPRKMREKKEKIKQIFTCKICGKTCKSSSNLSSHMRTHSGERPYYCDVCGMGFKQIAHLRSHLRVHTGERPYVCDHCGKAFTQSSRLNSHKKARHSSTSVKRPKKEVEPKDSKIRNFYCPICKKTFLDVCFKREHMEQHRSSSSKEISGQNSFSCDICGIVYSSKVTYKKHKLQHSDSKLMCHVCGCTFVDSASFRMHSSVAHGIKIDGADHPPSNMYFNVKIGKEQDFVVVNSLVPGAVPKRAMSRKRPKFISNFGEDLECPVIEITEVADGKIESKVEPGTALESDYLSDVKVVHVHKGTKDEPITSSVDADGFDISTLQTEIKQEVLEDGVKKENCGTEKTRTKRPRRTFDYLDDLGRKVWKCKMCPKTFFQSSNLHCHIRSHTGEKPYKCNVCPKSFRQITHLKEHMHRHTGRKSHGCSVCGAHFTQRGAVKKHISVIHNGKGEVENVCSYSERKTRITGSNGCLFVRRRSKKPRGRKNKRGNQDDSGSPSTDLVLCETCGKEYKANYIAIHQRCHSGEKPYKCKYCDATFRQKIHLNQHIITHSGKKPFVCSLCGSSYMHIKRLRRHKEVCVGDKKARKPLYNMKIKLEPPDDNDSASRTMEGDSKIVIPQHCTDQGKDVEGEGKENVKERIDYSCYLCEAPFSSIKRLEIHEKTCSEYPTDSECSFGSDKIPYDDESDDDEILKNIKKELEGVLSDNAEAMVSSGDPVEESQSCDEKIKSGAKRKVALKTESPSCDENSDVGKSSLNSDVGKSSLKLNSRTEPSPTREIDVSLTKDSLKVLSNAGIKSDTKKKSGFTVKASTVKRDHKGLSKDSLSIDNSYKQTQGSGIVSGIPVKVSTVKRDHKGLSKDSLSIDNSYKQTQGSGIVCKLCQAQFKRLSAFKFHYKIKHENDNSSSDEGENNEGNARPCDTKLSEQSKYHKSPRKIKVKSDKLLKKSVSFKESEGLVVKLSCAFCQKEFQDTSDLGAHIVKEHPHDPKSKRKDKERVVKKDLSKSSDSSLGSGKSENEGDGSESAPTNPIVIDEKDKSLYTCDECGAAFSRASKLKHHVGMWCKGKTSRQAYSTAEAVKCAKKSKSISDSSDQEKSINEAHGAGKCEDSISADTENQRQISPEQVPESVKCDSSEKSEEVASDRRLDDSKVQGTSGESSESLPCVNESSKISNDLVCSQCTASFKTKPDLTAHLKTHKEIAPS